MSKVEQAYGRIERALTENRKVKALWAAFSGGGDSITAARLASEHPMFRGVIHVNTKTSPAAELTSRHARHMAEHYGWKFIEVSPFMRLEMLAVRSGFPSPDSHQYAYQYLKGRPLAQGCKIAKALLVDEILGESSIEIASSYQMDSEGGVSFIDNQSHNKKRKSIARKVDIALISGIRRLESNKRSTAPEFGISEGRLWINAIVDWSKQECEEYLNRQTPGVSGECDCFAHASRDEVEYKCATIPLMEQYREKLEELVRISRELQLLQVQAGMRKIEDVIDEHDTVWGNGRKNTKVHNIPKEQLSLFDICNDCDGGRDTGIGKDIEYAIKFANLRQVENSIS